MQRLCHRGSSRHPAPHIHWNREWPQLGVVATNVPDLNLHIAETLSELRLPATLARHVLSAAVQDFIDEATPTDANDCLCPDCLRKMAGEMSAGRADRTRQV